MGYTKRIVVLANSRKLNARCVAGREWNGNELGEWVRPVTGSETGEVGLQRYSLTEGKLKDPELLDIVDVPLLQHVPSGCQIENHLINEQQRWNLTGAIRSEQLLAAVENVNGPLWFNGRSTSNGHNDEIPADIARTLPSSLILVQPERLELVFNIEGAGFGRGRPRVRGHFSLSGNDYTLMVTDPRIEAEFSRSSEGAARSVTKPMLCISISEVFKRQNACYKLIAGVIEPGPGK